MRIQQTVLPGFIWILLLPTLGRAEAPHTVLDEAELFRPQTVERVRRRLDALYARDGIGVLIETIRTLPLEQRDQLARAGNAKAGRIFAAWTRRRARDNGVDGIYVLISADPSYRLVHVTTWPEEMGQVFSERDCNQVRLAFVDRRNAKHPDDAVLDAVAEIESILSYNLGSTTSFWLWVLIPFGGVVGTWLIALYVRSQRRDQPVARGADAALPGMLGGMLGTPANQWLYDKSLQQPPADS